MAFAPLDGPERSLTETLQLAETVVWLLLAVGVAVLLAAAVAGAFIVSSRSVGVSLAALLAVAVVGTLVAVAADVAFE